MLCVPHETARLAKTDTMAAIAAIRAIARTLTPNTSGSEKLGAATWAPERLCGGP